MDPLWTVPAVVVVLGVAPLAYLLREVTLEVRALRRDLTRVAAVRTALHELQAEVERRPAPGGREGRR